MTDDQMMLSRYDAGNTKQLSLSTESLSEKNRVKEYIESVDAFDRVDHVTVMAERISFTGSDHSLLMVLEVDSCDRWAGYHKENRSIYAGSSRPPNFNRECLQAAIDHAAKMMREYEREELVDDVDAGDGGDQDAD